MNISYLVFVFCQKMAYLLSWFLKNSSIYVSYISYVISIYLISSLMIYWVYLDCVVLLKIKLLLMNNNVSLFMGSDLWRWQLTGFIFVACLIASDRSNSSDLINSIGLNCPGQQWIVWEQQYFSHWFPNGQHGNTRYHFLIFSLIFQVDVCLGQIMFNKFTSQDSCWATRFWRCYQALHLHKFL